MTVAAMPATTTPTTRRPKLNTVRPDDKPIRQSRTERPDPAPQAPFVKFRVDVLTDGSLSASARIVYALLVHHHSKERGCFPGRDLLADELGASIPTVDRVLNELCAAKLIVKKRQGRGHNNTYSFPLESSPVMTQVMDDSSSVIVQPDESSLVSTPESSPVMTLDSSLVMTPYVTRTNEQEPTEQDHYVVRTNEIVRWFAKRVGGVVAKPGSKPWDAAHDLAEAGARDADLDDEFVWLQGEAWVKSISLSLMAAKYNDWKSTRVAGPQNVSPADYTEHFNKLRRLRSRLFDAFEFETYVTAPDGEARYQADLVKYTALVEGAEGRA